MSTLLFAPLPGAFVSTESPRPANGVKACTPFVPAPGSRFDNLAIALFLSFLDEKIVCQQTQQEQLLIAHGDILSLDSY